MCGFRHHTLFLIYKQKMSARRHSRVILGSLCRDLKWYSLQWQKTAKIARISLFAVPKVVKLKTEVKLIPVPWGCDSLAQP